MQLREEGGHWFTTEGWVSLGFVLLEERFWQGDRPVVSTRRHGEPEAEQGESLVQPPETGSDDGRPEWRQGRLERAREAGVSQKGPGVSAECTSPYSN